MRINGCELPKVAHYSWVNILSPAYLDSRGCVYTNTQNEEFSDIKERNSRCPGGLEMPVSVSQLECIDESDDARVDRPSQERHKI